MSKEKKRDQLLSLLGDLPERKGVLATKLKEEEREHYILEYLLLNFGETEKVPAYFVRPKRAQGQQPAVLFNHSHGGQYDRGKAELLESSPYLQNPSFAEELTQMGYSALCMDMWGFGERQGKTESELFKEMLWNGQVMWGMMLYDSLCGIDYLTSREDVDNSRIATLGMSMGGLMAWWLAALDERVRVCIDIAAQVDAQSLIRQRGLDHHGFYSYVPGLLKTFETADIQSLIVPRPHLSLVGDQDRLTPYDGLGVIDERLKVLYEKEGKSAHWRMSRYPCGHKETAGMRQELRIFLQNYL
ncbi:dienelactone hydrolase family protein [Domibacillus robiginosus]|uniref:dienelactone hydrolase family protein n=1 Tax=Domibacillus robiginosus TaxID=1071054 RepID=UPI00067DF4D0|nr:CocE/NonD family hydrolase [Domibacillus robiginosus]